MTRLTCPAAHGGHGPILARATGWGARIRTWEWRNQNPLPYHLATPHRARHAASARRTILADASPINNGAGAVPAVDLTRARRRLDCRKHLRRGTLSMTYRAPVADIAFTLRHAAGFAQARDEGLYGDLADDTVDAVLEQAGKFATDVIEPLNKVGDRHGTPFKDGAVTTPPGWKDAYTAWAEAGWNGLASPEQWGGQELPNAINAACIEMWNSASMAFGIGPTLTMAAIDALAAHGTEPLRQAYLPKLVSGEWMGTMQLTEPQAGSDVGALRTKAERAGDGTYRITGSKIFITYGEHDLTDNIIHFVLARLPDAPPGSRGISLFLVPKFLL